MFVENILILVIIFILLVISATLSGLETAVTAASKAKIHQLAKEGGFKAAIVKDLQQNIGLVISGILMVNTIFNAISVSLMTGLIIEFMGSDGIAGELLASFVMAAILVVYAEVLPKMLAVRNPENMILKFAPSLRILFKVIHPMTTTMTWIAQISLKIVRYKIPQNAADHASVDELKGVIDLHHGPGQDVAHERAMLKSVLDLGSVQVSEIMTHRKNVTMVNADDPLDLVFEQILATPYTRIPVWQGTPDDIVGVLHIKTLLKAIQATRGSYESIKFKDIAADPWFIPANTDLLDQLHAFRSRREHFAMVVDEYGAIMGIVTLEDVLEEIVGEISDEHDLNVLGVRPQTDGSYIIDGTVTIRDLNREFEWDLPADDASTIAGLILHKTRMIPDVGQWFIINNFRIQILRRYRNQIMLVQIYPPIHDL